MNDTASVTADQLRAFIERVETLETEKQEVTDQIKEVLSEAKGSGYESKIIRKIVAIRKRNRDDVENVEIVFAAKGFLVPAHRPDQGVQRVTGAVFLAPLDINAQIDFST